MRTNPLTILVILLTCLHMSLYGQPATSASTLSVGDVAPPLKVFKWIKGEPVTEFKNGHVYIVEFGATWCGPCAAAIPELSAVSRKFRGKATVISAFVMEYNDDPSNTSNPSYVNRVEKYVARRGDQMDYRVAVDDPSKTLEQSWLKATKKVGIPHTFVIDKEGRIAWIGSNPKLLDGVIDAVVNDKHALEKNTSNAPGTQPSSNNPFSPLKEWLNDGGESILFFSMLSKYESGQTGEPTYSNVDNFRWTKPDSELYERRGKIIVLGQSLRVLYAMAFGDTLWNYPMSRILGLWTFPDTIKNPHQRRSYGKYWYRPILEMKDTSQFEAKYPLPHNRFNYMLKVPREKGTAKYLQQLMQRDLETYFGYRVRVEKRQMPCWFLKASAETQARLKSKVSNGQYKMYEDEKGNGYFKNAEVRDLIHQLEIRYGCTGYGALTYRSDCQPPFIDATGITGNIDYTYPEAFASQIMEEFNGGKIFTFEGFKTMLEEMGFQLVKGTKEMNVVVIKDK